MPQTPGGDRGGSRNLLKSILPERSALSKYAIGNKDSNLSASNKIGI